MTSEQQLEYQERLGKFSSLKAVQILGAISFMKKECGINEISRLTALSKSTVHRVLQELVGSGLVVKEGKKYHSGVMLRSLFETINEANFLVEAAKDEMDRLNDLTLETIHIIIRENTDAVYLAKRNAKSQIGLRSVVGKHIPLYCTSGGKVLLAYQSEKWLEEYFSTVPRDKLTDHTIVDETLLRAELQKVREQGYALDNGEHNPEVICVAAPLFFADGKIAGTIGVSTPKYRISEEKLELFIRESMASAEVITNRLK